MQHIEEFLSGFQAIELARNKLQTPNFENIVFRFIETRTHLSKSSKVTDYQRTLDRFRVEYYNEFLYKCRVRSVECIAFINELTTFSNKQKIQKKDYVNLFDTLCSYYKGSVGGTKNGIPLLCTPQTSLRDAPAYYMDWCYDQVQNIRKEMNIQPNTCVFTGKKAKETLVGHYFCPAACLPIGVDCEINNELISRYLEKTKPFMLPSVSVAAQQYLSEVFKVCEGLSKTPELSIRDIQLSLDARGNELLAENKRLKDLNRKHEQKLKDFEVVQKHIVEDNEETRVSLGAVHREREIVERKFLQCERAYYECRHRLEEKKREILLLNQRWSESVKQQWDYYNLLRRHGIIR